MKALGDRPAADRPAHPPGADGRHDQLRLSAARGRLGGVGLPATEMIVPRSLRGAALSPRRSPRSGLFERLWGVKDEPRPLAVQVWDNDPDTLAAVGRRLVHEYRPSVIDLNFGCPVPAVAKKAESGSYCCAIPSGSGGSSRGWRPPAGRSR